MKLTELGFDYENLSSCNVSRKNFILALVFAILLVCFLPIFIIFLVMYIAHAPMETNGVILNYGDPSYESTYMTILGILGSLSGVSVVLTLLSFISKPKTYFIMDKNTVTFHSFFYIFNRKKQEEIYLTEKIAYIYNIKYNKVMVENNPNTLHEMLHKFIFWKDFDGLKNYKVINKSKKTVLKFTTDKSYNSRTKLRKVYSFSNDINVVPVTVTETITYASYGNRNSQNIYKYYFEDINRKQYFEIHPEIKKMMSVSS